MQGRVRQLKSNEQLREEMFNRIILIVNLLLANPGGITTEELAAACGAGPELVRTDLERICEYGRAPLLCSSDELDDPQAVPGVEDEVWSLASREFAFPISSLTQREAALLLEVLESSEGVQSAKERLKASLSDIEAGGAPARAASRRVIKSGRTMYGEGQEESRIDEIEMYLARSRPLHMVYVAANNSRSERHVCPVALVYDWRTCAWYLYGYNDEHGIRHFRVSRIAQFGQSTRKIQPPSDEEVRAHVTACWGVECSSKPEEVVVRFSDDFNVLSRMRADTADRLGARYEQLSDGSVIFRNMMPGYNEFRAWVSTFGESAEVLKPEGLRLTMAASVKRVLERYGL